MYVVCMVYDKKELKVFARFHSADEHEAFIKGLLSMSHALVLVVRYASLLWIKPFQQRRLC